MNATMKLWLLGMGILPEQVEKDEALLNQIKIGEQLGAWERLRELCYQASINPYPEFSSPSTQLEFMSIVAGKPMLWLFGS